MKCAFFWQFSIVFKIFFGIFVREKTRWPHVFLGTFLLSWTNVFFEAWMLVGACGCDVPTPFWQWRAFFLVISLMSPFVNLMRASTEVFWQLLYYRYRFFTIVWKKKRILGICFEFRDWLKSGMSPLVFELDSFWTRSIQVWLHFFFLFTFHYFLID